MAINTQKFLPSTTSGSLKIVSRMSSSFDKNLDSLLKSVKKTPGISGSKILESEEDGGGALVIRKKVLEIKNIVVSTTLLKSAEAERKRKEDEKKKRSKKEEKIEEKPTKEAKKIGMPSIPKLGFLDRVKNFITSVLFGYIAYRLIDYLPKFLEFIKVVGPAFDFLQNVAGQFFNGLVTFVDWGYQAVEKTEKFIKDVGGESTLKLFKQFEGALTTFVNTSLILGMLAGGGRGRVKPKVGYDKSGRIVKPKVQQRYLKRFGKTAFTDRFGAKNLKNISKGPTRFLTKGIARIPVIGALIDLAINLAMGESIGRSVAKAAGAAVGSALGTLIPVPFAGTILGGYLGDVVGGVVYDTLTSGKKQAAAEGGQIRRGNRPVGGAVRRTIRKKPTKRTLTVQSTPVKPGADVGGEKKIKKIFPETEQTNQVNPYGFMKKSSKIMSSADAFGPLFALQSKAQVGQKPSKTDYRNAAQGLNAWMSNAFIGGGTRGGVAYAEGGSVDVALLSGNSDMTDWIEKSIYDFVSPKVDNVLRDLMKNLMLKQEEKPKEEGVPAETQGAGAYSPEGLQGEIYQYLLSKGMSDAHALGLMANIHRESGFRPGVSEAGGPGVGLFQYSSGGRKDAFLKAVPDYATNWKGQIDYALREPGEPGQQYLSTKFSSPQEAADWFMRKWERPAEYIQNTEGPRIHREYLAGLEKYKTKQGYKIPTGVALGGGVGNLSAAQQLASSMGLQLTSAKRAPRFPGDRSLHIQGRAMDFSNDGVGRGTPQQLAFAQKMIAQYGSSLEQLIYTPLGFGISKGKQVPLSHWGESTNRKHYDHVHVAFAKGGRVSRPTKALIGEKGPEFIFDADTTKGLDQMMPNLLEHLNNAKNKKELSEVLRSYAGYENSSNQTIAVKLPPPKVIIKEVPVPTMNGGISIGGVGSDPFAGLAAAQ
jgi:hypothetical protein